MFAAILDDTLTLIVLIGAAVGVVSRWVVLPMWHAIRAAMRVVDYIGGEMHKNGGTTLRDAVDRIEKRLHVLDERMHRIEEAIPQEDSA